MWCIPYLSCGRLAVYWSRDYDDNPGRISHVVDTPPVFMCMLDDGYELYMPENTLWAHTISK